ncbi:MAG: RsmD family RNA methyltransferase, partial [Holosporales bacterium]|nr:RsmD family RNA methyltransferase [Holosporales bacterium]
MKICLGSLKNKPIFCGNIPETRPTKQRIRKCIFDVIQHRFFGDFSKISVLDGFSGTGVFGFEAISLGARFVQFAENDQAAAHSIARSISTLGIQDKCSLFVGDLLALKSALGFDLIFLDPPYFHDLVAGAVRYLLLNNNIETAKRKVGERSPPVSQTTHRDARGTTVVATNRPFQRFLT